MSGRDKKEKKALVGAILFMIIVAIIGVTTWLLTHKTETYISEGGQDTSVSSLECEAMQPADPFFTSSVAQSFKHNLKLIFKGDTVGDLSYNFEGTYNSATAAEAAMADFHARYNKYMTKYGVNEESYNPVFSAIKTKVKVSLYAEKEKLNSAIATIFFITDEELKKVDDYKAVDFKQNYESKGFYCVYNE